MHRKYTVIKLRLNYLNYGLDCQGLLNLAMVLGFSKGLLGSWESYFSVFFEEIDYIKIYCNINSIHCSNRFFIKFDITFNFLCICMNFVRNCIGIRLVLQKLQKY